MRVVAGLLTMLLLVGCGGASEPDIGPAIGTLSHYCTNTPEQLRADTADAQHQLLAMGIQTSQLAILHAMMQTLHANTRVNCTRYFSLVVSNILLTPTP
ncbi:MAG TPA: hypothetical protein VGP33_14725 [Chloroflexota bacterium]|nr:hypothetical protein [Chloroflexota bacterium]